MDAETLGRFGHHPDPADDFCIEVECLQGEWENHKTGFMNGTPSRDEVKARVFRAMTAGPFITERCLNAKGILRQVEQEMRAAA